MFGISAFSQSPFSTLGAGAVLLGEANITADATLVSAAVRLRTSSGAITTNGILESNGI